MKKYATVALSSLLALAACQPASNPSAPDASPSSPATASGTALPEALPQGFQLAFPYHYTKKEVVRGRKQRQRITVEFLEGDAASIAGSLTQSAIAVGFSKGLWGVQKDGSIHFVADKPGFGQLRAQIRSGGDEKMQNPSAKGSVTMGWPLRALPTSGARTVPTTPGQ
ncbi:hypothetical protein [Lysobacter sp. M15]|uniref:hypothetical protein n=1 Tax=Lysobacter sp. M15 TaxID=2916837 RepID=UPI001F59577B|nr:hypothetical protein [Lysobacter sp. M15]